MLIDSYLKKVAVDTFLERYYFDMKKNHTWPSFILFLNNF